MKNEPTAFVDIYKEEINKKDDYWINRLNGGTILFLKINKKIVGMTGVYYKKDKDKLIAVIWGVYINKKYRGKGYGFELLNESLNKVYLNKEVAKIILCVNTDKISAIKLYEKLGFRTIDKKEKALRNIYDEYIMEKRLKKK